MEKISAISSRGEYSNWNQIELTNVSKCSQSTSTSVIMIIFLFCFVYRSIAIVGNGSKFPM